MKSEYVKSGESFWRNKEGNKNKGHEQDGKINQRLQRVILQTEEK